MASIGLQQRAIVRSWAATAEAAHEPDGAILREAPASRRTRRPAVVALENDRRIPITEEQRIVIRLVKQARAVDRGYRALLLGTDVDQLDSGAALEQCLQIRRRQLTNRRRFVCRSVIAQRSSILVRQTHLVKSVTGELQPSTCDTRRRLLAQFPSSRHAYHSSLGDY